MAVGKFQKANGIQVTGQLNGPTIEALNPPSRAKRLDAILATMERWRWMPRDLGKTHVELNIPDYLRSRLSTTARRSGRPAPSSASRGMRRRCSPRR